LRLCKELHKEGRKKRHDFEIAFKSREKNETRFVLAKLSLSQAQKLNAKARHSHRIGSASSSSIPKSLPFDAATSDRENVLLIVVSLLFSIEKK
jgi:copper oxidase (laccase) domain-containing protein